MYFTIGGHPAFRVPVREGESQSDYRLAFEGLDTLTYLLIDTSVGTVLADEPHTLSLENGTCSIAPHMFDKDALLFLITARSKRPVSSSRTELHI